MPVRLAHRVRWAAVWTLLLAWVVFLVLDRGGGLVNVLLAIAIVALVYELLAADRP